MRKIIFLAFILAIVSCSNMVDNQLREKYQIINEESMHNIKTSITVRLQKEQTKDTLRMIANQLRNDGRTKYQKIFIFHLLPEMEKGKGAWATTHFNDNLEVEILGMTKESIKELIADSESIPGTLVGKWLSNYPYMGGVYTIFKENNQLKLKVKYQVGSGSTEDLITKNSKGKTIYKVRGCVNDDYYLINSKNELEIHDNEGLIVRMKILL